MMVKDIILNISAVFPLRLKVTAGIIDHLTAVKYKLQILKLQSVQIHFFYMEDSACACQNRRSKHLSYRDIHICHTVFKVCLFFDILQCMKMNDKICFIAVLSFDLHPLAGIQSFNDRLLDFFIKLIVQCIDLYDLIKNLREVSSDLRHRIGDNGKASLISFDIAVDNLTGFIVKLHLKLLLSFA